MLLIDNILLSPARGILWVFEEINDLVQKELDGEAKSITEQLRTLYMQLETGRITEAQFDTREKLLLDRLDSIESSKADDEEEENEDYDEEDDTLDQDEDDEQIGQGKNLTRDKDAAE